MSAPTKLQDMPPKGGYQKIFYARNPARSYFNGYQLIAAYFGVTAAGLYLYYLNSKDNHREEVEMRSARFAIYPLLLAERDREYMKQLRRNREEEETLMADVKGWKVGTWYGEPIYKTKPNDWIEPQFQDFYAHTDYKSFAKRAFLKMMS